MGVADTFRLTPVGVFFGEGPGVRSPDPYFGGAGPERTGCLECGACMTGCRYGAKNHANHRISPQSHGLRRLRKRQRITVS